MPITKKVKPLRIAVAGCGWFGNFHIDNLLKMENIEIVALFNRGVEKLQKTGLKVPKARLYQDLDKMILKEKIDAMIVCVTPDSHGSLEAECCKKGIHMFIEKPVENSLERAKEISETIKLSNIITSVGYQERYSSVMETIKEIVEKEPIGIVNGYWIGSMPGAQWWRTKAQSGGQIVEQSTHIIDIFRYIFGEVSGVYMSGDRNESFEGLEHDVEDFSSGVIKFKSGVLASLQSACYIKDGGPTKLGFEIIMPRCIVEYKWGQSVKIITNELTKEINLKQESHLTCLEVFIEAVRTGDRYQIKSTYEDAVKTLEVSTMANQSIESGQFVHI